MRNGIFSEEIIGLLGVLEKLIKSFGQEVFFGH